MIVDFVFGDSCQIKVIFLFLNKHQVRYDIYIHVVETLQRNTCTFPADSAADKDAVHEDCSIERGEVLAGR